MEEQKSKKFVFNLNEENGSLIETLSYEQKNDLINKLLLEYRMQFARHENDQKLYDFVKKISLIILLIIAGVPVFLMTVNFCFNATLNSYSQMEKNFERLFHEQQK